MGATAAAFAVILAALFLAPTSSDSVAEPSCLAAPAPADPAEHLLLQFGGQRSRLQQPSLSDVDPKWWDSPPEARRLAQDTVKVRSRPPFAEAPAEQPFAEVYAGESQSSTPYGGNDYFQLNSALRPRAETSRWIRDPLVEELDFRTGDVSRFALTSGLDSVASGHHRVSRNVLDDALDDASLPSLLGNSRGVRNEEQEAGLASLDRGSLETAAILNDDVSGGLEEEDIFRQEALQGQLIAGSADVAAATAALLHDRAFRNTNTAPAGFTTAAKMRNKSCGFAGGEEPSCDKMAFYSCQTPSENALSCPKSCGYLLADPLFACLAACVPENDCKLGGRAMGFADPATKTCGPGPIQGCTQYNGTGTCDKCAKLFDKTEDGKDCIFLPGYQQFALVLGIVLIVIILIVLPLNFYRWCWKPVARPAMLAGAWRHRLRAQASQTMYDDPTREPVRYPLSTNMHHELVAGPGLCLFYNSLVFLIFASLFVAFSSALIWGLTELPALDSATCEFGTPKEFESAAGDVLYQKRVSALGYFLLWIVLFAFSLYWARVQRLTFRMLDKDHALMCDFALRVTGLPPDASERECYSYFERISPGSLVGVSVAYNYVSHARLIDTLVRKHVVMEEKRHARMMMQALPEEEQAEDVSESNTKRLAESILSRLQGSGMAFVVCKSEADRKNVYEAWLRHNFLFRGQTPIKLHDVYEEPSCFFWENFAYDRWKIIGRGIVESLICLIECVILGLIVYWPAAYYIFYRIMQTGTDWDPVVMVLGYVIALMNMIMYFLVDISSRRVGYHYKVDVDISNLLGCTAIVGVQSFFNLAVAYYAVQSVDSAMSDDLFSGLSSEERQAHHASEQMFIAAKLWNLLVPGVLIIPDLLGRFFKYVLSAKAMYNYWVYIPFLKRDLRTDVEVSQFDAEEQLLPHQLQTEFDYSNNICMASVAFSMLFFHSAYGYLTCCVLVIWVVLSYVTLKYCHLRFNMIVDYTSFKLDDCSAYLWSIPLSILAALWASWTASLMEWPWWITIIAFVASLASYLFLVHKIMIQTSPFDDRGKGHYYDAKQHLRYDYFNTNPIMVLKSQYLKEGKPLTYFVRGKEYLQKPEDGPLGQSEDENISEGCAPGCSKLFSF